MCVLARMCVCVCTVILFYLPYCRLYVVLKFVIKIDKNTYMYVHIYLFAHFDFGMHNLFSYFKIEN